MLMPKPDADVISRRTEIITAMQGIVPGEGVISDENELQAYDCDGLLAYRAYALLPDSSEGTGESAFLDIS